MGSQYCKTCPAEVAITNVRCLFVLDEVILRLSTRADICQNANWLSARKPLFNKYLAIV